MFELRVAALHMHASVLAHSKDQMSLKELQGPLPGLNRAMREESEGRGGRGGEVARIRGSRIANDFSRGVRQLQLWLTCLD